ncbi:nucleolar protein of 40 kDa isoform X2 [Corvus moneduloides]|uniref:nucleolar protein of 40 kDa isoform X2 n=1 Tax=Corvus moneduloides TaxID=1196302 RepID=UPI0013633FB8|nr:nucleolar protein of 40 kDa isoform X2 [Corvus moneduloides]
MEPLPELYSIFQGEVAAVTDFGAFVAIPGCRKQGLVHRTHMSSCRVDKPSEIVDVGDKVWVKLIGKEMKEDKLKLSLSMKVVHQGTGKDLDPNNVCLDQDERKKRTFRDYTSQKITLEAVLNTVCKKCGCKGHFAKECFMQPGGTKYSLIPEEEEEEVAAAGREGDKKISKAEESSKKRKKVQGEEEEEEEAQGQAVLRVGLGELSLGQRWSSALQQEAQALREAQQGSQEEEAQEAQEVALG